MLTQCKFLSQKQLNYSLDNTLILSGIFLCQNKKNQKQPRSKKEQIQNCLQCCKCISFNCQILDLKRISKNKAAIGDCKNSKHTKRDTILVLLVQS